MRSYACVSLIQIVTEYKCLDFASKMAEEPVYFFLRHYLTSVEIFGQEYTCLRYKSLSGWISTQGQSLASTADPRERGLVPIHLFCRAPTCQMVFGLSVCARILLTLWHVMSCC